MFFRSSFQECLLLKFYIIEYIFFYLVINMDFDCCSQLKNMDLYGQKRFTKSESVCIS